MSVKRKKSKNKHDFYESIIDDFNPDNRVCEIIKTSIIPKADAFTAFRPAPNTCADYTISQTDTKFDAGDTKVHIQQTEATYEPLTEPPPPPPKKKKKRNKYFSGGPPQWEFVDEIWREKQEELQKCYHEQFAIRIAKKRKEEKHKLASAHERAIAMVGPAWFQELSPKQIKTVDDLKKCILKDYRNGSIINTQENIASLGLVLRPNPKHIAKALKECCKCPVEFLLILYQLTNPTRTKYSMNDRLLLSAVVHLTMRDTLRELHIRIPSPPRPPKPPPNPIKKMKKIDYESPYLIPYTFKKEPRKFTGIYVNKHRQYPESPYFTYLEQLKKTMKHFVFEPLESGVDPVDQEITNETLYAQTLYEQLVDFRPVRNLIPPSRYNPCYNFWNKRPESVSLFENLHDLETKPDDVIEVAIKEIEDGDEKEEEEDNGGNGDKVDLIYMLPDNSPPIEEEPDIKEEATNTFSVETATCYRLEDYCAPVEKPKPLCDKCLEDKEKDNIGYIVNGLKQTESELIPIIGGIFINNTPKRLDALNILEKQKLTVNHESHKIEFVKTEEAGLYPKYPLDSKPCYKCRDDVQRFLDLPPCNCEKCVTSRKLRRIQFSIMGTKETENGLMPVVGGVSIRKPCNCLEKYEKQIKDFEDYANKPCKCEDVARFELNKPLCLCERCVKSRERSNYGYIISGLQQSEDGLIPIVGGVYIKRPCKCLENYEKRIKDMVDFAKRMNAVRNLKKQKNRYIIGGLVQRPDGPVYIVQGMCPEVKCCCLEKLKQEEKEQKRLQNMPKLPPSRITYGIAGVKETPEGNVFILTHALATEDCYCMEMYNKFEEEHKDCLKLYETYLSNMKEDINDYMNDLLPNFEERRESLARRNSSKNDDAISESLITNEESDYKFKPIELAKDKVEEVNVIQSCPQYRQEIELKCVEECISPSPPYPCAEEEKKKEPVCEPPSLPQCQPVVICKKSSSQSKKKSCCKKKKPKKTRCGCCKPKPEVVDCIDCTCGPPPEPEIEEIPIEEEIVEEEEERDLKRFFIFDRIPCDRKWHLEILKRALETMANDGYPLAKLPDCHKLPHFKLWMEMRCGKYWTQEDRYQFTMMSKTLWRHTDVCYKKIRTPKPKISKEEAELMTWANADICKKMASDAVCGYYRKLRQQTVGDGREFFPTTFSYEFPFKTFRDCFFAYIPAKEEEVLSCYVWAPFEVKNFSKRKSCIC